MTFGEKLYQLRKRHGFSQEALAEKLNTTRQAVSKWENNNGYPETEKIILLAKLFQVSLDDLLMEERDIGAASDDGDRNGEKQYADKREKRDEYYVNRETANGFLLYYKKKFLWIAVACGLILGCNAVSYSSLEPGFYELMVQPILTTLSVMALLSISFYIVLKQNPYRNLRNRELIFSEDVRRELWDEFKKMKKVLLAGIVVCLAVVGINEMYFNYFLSINWKTMYLMSEAEMRQGDVFYMILVGVCAFVAVFCAGVYWSYAVLLRNQSEKNI
ncbi:MAG: helix-turn-helix domain-containing protein [Lachnospiraceae bacterium]|nr:helix-turn-helix domain-containing protein [Lachnospiraceae bacterium]